MTTQTFSSKDIIVSDNLDLLVNNQQVPTDSMILLVCRAGQLRIEINQMSYDMKENDLLFCMPDFLLGHYMHTPDFQCYMLTFTSESLKDVIYSCLCLESHWFDKLLYLKNRPIISLTGKRAEVCYAYGQLFGLYAKETNVYQKRIHNVLAQALIYEMISWVDETMQSEPAVNTQPLSVDASNHTMQLFGDFMNLLQQNRSSRHSVSWYADKMAISAKYLTYICNQVSKRTPSDFINEIAVREIKRRLTGTNDSIKEIAIDMDFSTASSFCKYFRLHTGMSAQAYRKQMR
ncbi:MAG: helix-turn-helix domain-containing protein [Paludibacteraceae bacterium]